LQSISWDIAIGLAFVVGLLLFGISTSMLRTARESPHPPAKPRWPRLIDEDLSEVDRDLRLDMIERLSIVRSEWSRGVLQHARTEERDPELLSAIDTALAH
jgi:hypothetical protein